MIVYQLHVGTFAIRKPGVASNFLDVALKIPYLADLGINVLQPLPVDEQEAHPSMGYGGADLFSPDFPYIAVEDLPFYLARLNELYAAKHRSALALADIQSGPGQLKALIDLCHLYGIAVVLDVVYNHAGGFSVNGQLDDNCLYYMDRRTNRGNNNDSLYFTDQDRGTGGLAFALWNDGVSKFLIDNARYYLEELHADGFRYDEISTLISTNQGSGWEFCRALTSNLRGFRNRILQNAEFWAGRFADIPASPLPVVAPAEAGGMGFDVVQHDYLRSVLAAPSAQPLEEPTPTCRCRLYRRRFTRPRSTTPGAPSPVSRTMTSSWQAATRGCRRWPTRPITAPGTREAAAASRPPFS